MMNYNFIDLANALTTITNRTLLVYRSGYIRGHAHGSTPDVNDTMVELDATIASMLNKVGSDTVALYRKGFLKGVEHAETIIGDLISRTTAINLHNINMRSTYHILYARRAYIKDIELQINTKFNSISGRSSQTMSNIALNETLTTNTIGCKGIGLRPKINIMYKAANTVCKRGMVRRRMSNIIFDASCIIANSKKGNSAKRYSFLNIHYLSGAINTKCGLANRIYIQKIDTQLPISMQFKTGIATNITTQAINIVPLVHFTPKNGIGTKINISAAIPHMTEYASIKLYTGTITHGKIFPFNNINTHALVNIYKCVRLNELTETLTHYNNLDLFSIGLTQI